MKIIISLTALFLFNYELLAQLSFTNASSCNVDYEPLFVTAADVNGDGALDLITANYGQGQGNTLSVLTNNGNGSFVLASAPIVGNGPRWVTAADVNNDGLPDLISANYGVNGSENSLSVSINSGNGIFTLASSPVLPGAPTCVVALDVNDDGQIDLISANRNNTMTVLTNDGTGSFVISGTYNVGSYPIAISAFTNVDGKINLVTANFSDSSLTVLTNDGSGGFAISSTLAVGSQPFFVTAADVNADGKMDLISANYGNNTLTIWTNNGLGGFGFSSSPAVGNQPFQVVAARLGGDGKVELVCANYAGGTITVLTNNANGGFGFAFNLTVSSPSAVMAADVNGDGKRDLITANTGNSTVSIFLNTTPAMPRATGTAIVSFGYVVSVNVDNGGFGYTNTPVVRFLGGGGSGAGAIALVSNGVVTGFTITNNGSGYTNAPLVVIDPPYFLNPVLGIAPMSFLTFSNLNLGGSYQLQQFVSYYWTNLPVTFTTTNNIYTQIVAGVVGSGNYRLAINPLPMQAFATSVVSFGFVTHATVTSGGSGYLTSPPVKFLGGGGINAAAVSQISSGVVTNITMTSLGTGYTSPPAVVIGQPPVAAVSPTVLPMMRVDAASLAPYFNYQVQFEAGLGSSWKNWNGGLFAATAATNSQYVFITNNLGFFRLQYVP